MTYPHLTINDMLEAARARLTRMYAFELPEAIARGALLVDIRPQASGSRRAPCRAPW